MTTDPFALDPGHTPMSATDARVLQVLVESAGRVLSRESLMRMTGIESVSPRRVDSSMVVLRRILGPDAIRTVRRRGWILTEEGLATARRFLSESDPRL